MTAWATFAGITGVVLVVLLVLSQLTQAAFTDGPQSSLEESPESDRDDGFDPVYDDTSNRNTATENEPASAPPESGTTAETQTTQSDDIDPRSLSTLELLANVAFSQGLFALILLGAAIYTGIPADALGIEFSWAFLEEGFLLGTVFGIGLYIANEIGAAVATRFGFDHDEELRQLLGPDSTHGWVVLLGIVLPIIALFEELLFRAALIGALEAGFGLSPWLLAVVSSIAFALGHGIQGSVGIVVTGLLGFVLAALFILTGSILVVVVAHYLINALEFIVHEGFDLEWTQTLES